MQKHPPSTKRHAWGNVRLDLFELNGNTYTDWLWTMSHASLKSRSYPSSNCRSVIPALNAIFPRHRGPGTLVSKDFCVPPPPPPPQSNGMAQRSDKQRRAYWRSPVTHTWLSSATETLPCPGVTSARRSS